VIIGNQTWQNALLQQTKQPLYVFEISEFGIIIASFTVASISIPAGGYGVVGYGVGGYGT
jgi:hypothetical protein